MLSLSYRAIRTTLTVGLAMVAAYACGSPQRATTAKPGTTSRPGSSSPTGATSLSAPSVASTEAAPTGGSDSSMTMLLDDPALMKRLDVGGLSLGERAFGAKRRMDNAGLSQLHGYSDWKNTVARRIRAAHATDRNAGVGMKYGHRVFDAGWLDSPEARFELVGVVNRYDRRPFAPEHCGESRLIYRLSYSTRRGDVPIASRLPMTVNLVLWQEPEAGGCQATWRRWIKPAAIDVRTWLGSEAGPRLASSPIKALEINLQNLRWPSTMHPTLGGHAEYLMMVFAPKSKHHFVASLLENQPKNRTWSRRERVEFNAWLRQPEQLRSLADGTIRIPDKYLADAAISVAPHGTARGDNRPFTGLFDAAAFGKTELAAMSGLANAAEAERRLDGLSCVGCHQSHSLAGFHFLGADPEAQTTDALHVTVSPHLLDELALRHEGGAGALKTGRTARLRGVPSRSYRHNPGGWGDHCSHGETFSDWTCAPGLRCGATSDAVLGVCERGGAAGEACEVGSIRRKSRSRAERAGSFERSGCREGVCETNRVGFPSGMCSTRCSSAAADVACGKIAVLTDFNQCLAAGQSFADCINDNSRPAGLRACDRSHPCRDDMICSRIGGPQGACIPPYFLFQLRVDGHPLSSGR